MQKTNSFDRLVAGLSLDDRLSILEQLKTGVNMTAENVISEGDSDDDAVISISATLKNESFIVRLVLFFKSLFSGEPIEVVYRQHRLITLAKKIEKNNPDILNAHNLNLDNLFYEKLIGLKRVADYFKDSIAEYEEDEGRFLVLLGSLVIPNLNKTIEKEVSPYSVPFSKEVPKDMRAMLIRKLDAIIAEIPQQAKTDLYICVQCLVWLKNFVQLPFEQFLAKFTAGANGKLGCTVHAAVADIEKFANVLCTAKKIETEVLETFYMLQIQHRMEAGEKIDVQEGIADYVNISTKNIAVIKDFVKSIPMYSIGILAERSFAWAPKLKDNGEDWFITYKAQWKKNFDKEWNIWLQDKKVALAKDDVTSFLKTEDYPLLPNRPWAKFSGLIRFSKEYSLGFLHYFLKNVYPEYTEVLKILMVNGDFILRENKIEFTESYGGMNNLFQDLKQFDEKLSDTGIYGKEFSQNIPNIMRTIQGQAQVHALMCSIESEASMHVLTFGDIYRSMASIFDGILVANYNVKYDGITNIATLMGPNKVLLRKHLSEISAGMAETIRLLQEIESIELISSDI